MLTNVNDAVLSFDENLQLTSWNRAAQKMYGWQEHEVLGRTSEEVLTSEFIGMTREEAILSLREKGRLKVEMLQHCMEGHRVWVEAKAMALRDHYGQTRPAM